VTRRDRCCRSLLTLALLINGCRAQDTRPSITFTKVPPADKGGPDLEDIIEGRVTGAQPGHRLVLFAHSEKWWAQPGPNRPYTVIRPDSTWRSSTHLGTEYAALLVDPGYRPPQMIDALPQEGGAVIRVAVVPGNPAAPAVRRTLEFSGYQWTARAAPSDRGGHNKYDPTNTWTDEAGALHLKIAPAAGDWTSAELSLTRSLGYGTYVFVVDDISGLDPAAVMTMFTWDGPAAEQNHREFDIEISRWGDASAPNAQYVVQPYFAPGQHVAKFTAPAGVLTHQIRWEPGRLTFRTSRGSGSAGGMPLVSERVFTSGVPSPGKETVRLNLYVYRRSQAPLQQAAEVVVREFKHIP
jgi:hypothetical protein